MKLVKYEEQTLQRKHLSKKQGQTIYRIKDVIQYLFLYIAIWYLFKFNLIYKVCAYYIIKLN